MTTKNTMQPYGVRSTQSSAASLARTRLSGWASDALQICLVFAVAFCGGVESHAAASGRNQAATATTGATSSLDQADPPAGNVRPDAAYIIGANDVLAINVWKEPDITRSIPVRSDGKISLPLIGDVQAAGRTPMQLEEDIKARLKDYITNPQVAVIVEQINSQKFNILGQVAKPGAFPLIAGTTIVDAIAVAGGFRDFAKKKGVYLLRQNSAGVEERFNFDYDKFIKRKNTAQNIRLMPNDTIVVP